jgi:hypothetical protein
VPICLDFFVLKTPCENLSARSIPLENYGWKTPWKKPVCLNRRLKDCSTNINLLYSAKDYSSLDEALSKAGLLNDFPKLGTDECACFYNCRKNQFMSVFYHIRNSLAHGRFNLIIDSGSTTYYLEDVVGKGEDVKLSARMVLKQETLIRWIELIKNGEKNIK